MSVEAASSADSAHVGDDVLEEVLAEYKAFQEASADVERVLKEQIVDRDRTIAALQHQISSFSSSSSSSSAVREEELSRCNTQLETDLLRLERQIREDEFVRTKLRVERDNAVLAQTAAEEERVTAVEELLELRRKMDQLRRDQLESEEWVASVAARLAAITKTL
jgi:hypothetical protein